MNSFSLSLSINELFCDRLSQADAICRNMMAGVHTVVYGPRRSGKTSLAHVVIDKMEDLGVKGIYVNLFPVTSIEDVVDRFYESVVESLSRNAKDKSALALRLAAIFKNLHLSVVFDPETKEPIYRVSRGDIPAQVHLEAMARHLDDFCEQQNLRVVVVIDEVQEITDLKEAKQIEESLCSGMSSAKNVSFFFLGSRQSVLRDMFENRKRPFYKKAAVVALSKISESSIVEYLVHTFGEGGIILSHGDARDICSFCESYPYYIQKLSMLYFNVKQKGGSLAEAKARLIDMESTGFENIFVHLTAHQKRLLKAVAIGRPSSIFSQSCLIKHNLGSHGGTQNSLAKLKSLDLVEQLETWRVVDPIFEKWLIKK